MNLNYIIAWLVVHYMGVNVVSELVQNFGNVVTSTMGTDLDDDHVSVAEKVNTLPVNNSAVEIFSDLNVTRIIDDTCPTLENAKELTQTQLINDLTAPCRYDRLERPNVQQDGSIVDTPVNVNVRVYVYVLQNLDTSNLQFRLHGLVQFRFNDPRLAFQRYAPLRNQTILGESSLRSLIWVPHIFLANEHDSGVLGTNEKDILTAISPDGTVIISSRIQATLFCWMKLQKFPFDEQFCPIVFESWMYNASELLLHWEQNTPIAFDPKMHLTEYLLQDAWSNATIINADLDDLRHGAFAGQYSSLSFTVHLTREVGYYVMDYFLPSIMIVAISWVSFWLQADQTPARTTLGCTTMLAFITLASSQENNLPKVSYIKVSEVWFLVCTVFIFGSLVEFAFVNSIWRRKHSVEVKKVKSKYILKSTLTPRMNRHRMVNSVHCDSPKNNNDTFLSVESPVVITVNDDPCYIIKDEPEQNNKEKPSKDKSSWSTMTPHEVSLWIDKKARFVFPLLFIIFNAFFWTFVYCL